MLRIGGWMVTLGLLLASPAWARGQYTVKLGTMQPPKELKEPIRNLLSEQSIQVTDGGNVVGEFWFRKQLPAKATPEQVKNGLTYRELEEGTLLGAVRFDQQFTDYRKQKIKPGVYTLRLGFQPMDGDHMGTAPYNEFALLVPAHRDLKPDALETKEVREQSARATTGSHPAVMLLFPNEKPDAMPKIEAKENETQVLSLKEPVVVGSQKADLGISLTVAGHTTAE